MMSEPNDLEMQVIAPTEEPASEVDAEPVFPDPQDVEKNKAIAALSYIFFFLPLIVCPESPYARFHANQSLLLFIVAVAGNIILGIIPFIGWILLPLFSIAVFVFAIMGFVNGFTGKAKKLPIFGRYTILK